MKESPKGEDPRRGASRLISLEDIEGLEKEMNYPDAPCINWRDVSPRLMLNRPITKAEQSYYLRSTHCSWEVIDQTLFNGKHYSYMLAYRFAKEHLLAWPPKQNHWLIDRQRKNRGRR